MNNANFSRAQYRQLRTQAEQMRTQGMSYKDILKYINVSKSTISIWCRNIKLTSEQIRTLGARYDSSLKGAKANQLKAQQTKEAVRKQGISEISSIDINAFKIAGAMLYWAEGDKSKGACITNSDPVLIALMIKWFKIILNLNPKQLSASLHLHQGQEEEMEIRFWSRLTKIPIKNFRKTFIKPIGTGHRKNILYHGTIKIRVMGRGGVLLRHRIMAWAEAVARYYVQPNIFNITYRNRVGR